MMQGHLTVASRRRKTTHSAIVLSNQSMKKFRESQDFSIPDPNLSPLEDSISFETDGNSSVSGSLSPVPSSGGIRERKKATLLKQQLRNSSASLISHWYKAISLSRKNRRLVYRYRQGNNWTLKQSDAVFALVLKWKTRKFMASKKFTVQLKSVHEVLAVMYDIFQKAERTSLLKTLVKKRRVQYYSYTGLSGKIEGASTSTAAASAAYDGREVLDVKTRMVAWIALSVFQELETAMSIDRQMAFGLVPGEVQLFRSLIKQLYKSRKQLYAHMYRRGILGRYCSFPSFSYYDTCVYYTEESSGSSSNNTSTSSASNMSMSTPMTPQHVMRHARSPSSAGTASTRSSSASGSHLLSSRERVALHLEMAAYKEELPAPPPPAMGHPGGMAPLPGTSNISPNGGRRAKMPFASSYTGLESLIDMSASMEALGVMGCDIMGPLSPGSKPRHADHTTAATVSPVVQMLMASDDNDDDNNDNEGEDGEDGEVDLDVSAMSVQDRSDSNDDSKEDSHDTTERGSPSSPSIKAMLINLKKHSTHTHTHTRKVVSPIPPRDIFRTPFKHTSASPVREGDSSLSRSDGSALRKSRLLTINNMLESLTDLVGNDGNKMSVTDK